MKKQGNGEQELFTLLKELTKVLRLFQSEAILCEGVTFNQFCILDHVAKQRSLELSKLHGLLAVEKSTTTRLVEPLVKRGFLVREKSLNDSRAIELQITGDGKAVHSTVWLCISNFIRSVMGQIPEGETENVFATLRLFIGSIDNCCTGCSCKE